MNKFIMNSFSIIYHNDFITIYWFIFAILCLFDVMKIKKKDLANNHQSKKRMVT